MMWVGVVDDIGPFFISLKRENYNQEGIYLRCKNHAATQTS